MTVVSVVTGASYNECMDLFKDHKNIQKLCRKLFCTEPTTQPQTTTTTEQPSTTPQKCHDEWMYNECIKFFNMYNDSATDNSADSSFVTSLQTTEAPVTTETTVTPSPACYDQKLYNECMDLFKDHKNTQKLCRKLFCTEPTTQPQTTTTTEQPSTHLRHAMMNGCTT